MNRDVSALKWIVGILNKNKVPFLVTGGFAAKIYGSKRRLNDIDIEIPKNGFKKILPDIRKYLVFGPTRYKDDNFDIFLITLNFHGQEIDMGANCKVYNSKSKRWQSVVQKLSKAENKIIWNIQIPVIKKSNLVKIKRLLGRKQDIKDIAATNTGR